MVHGQGWPLEGPDAARGPCRRRGNTVRRTAVISFPFARRKAFVHRTLRGFRLCMKLFLHFARQNRKTWAGMREAGRRRPRRGACRSRPPCSRSAHTSSRARGRWEMSKSSTFRCAWAGVGGAQVGAGERDLSVSAAPARRRQHCTAAPTRRGPAQAGARVALGRGHAASVVRFHRTRPTLFWSPPKFGQRSSFASEAGGPLVLWSGKLLLYTPDRQRMVVKCGCAPGTALPRALRPWRACG